VPNCSKAAFLRVLEYLYLDDFTVYIAHLVGLWHLVDFYQLEGLKHCCMGVCVKRMYLRYYNRLMT
jgi:hypothetical protein